MPLKMGCQKTPKAEDVNELRARIARLRASLSKPAGTYDTARLKAIDDEQKELDDRLKPLEADSKIDAAKWDALAAGDRRELGGRLRRLFADLRCLVRREHRAGVQYFLTFSLLFVLLVSIYVLAHRSHWRAVTQPPASPAAVQTPLESGGAAPPAQPAPGSSAKPAELSTNVPPERIVAVVSALRRVELAATAQRAAKPTTPPGTSEQQEALKKAVLETTDAVVALKASIDNLDLSFNSLQLFGNVEAEGKNESLSDTAESLTKLRTALMADLDSLRAGFFWNDRVKRWIEVAWWAEFGVLVGILFYIAGSIAEGRFETENISMYWTEVLIAPVVVAAIFFLFTLTGITGISPSESALPGNVGFGFIFGFAIRRTIGLLDNIKKRIFPEPSP